MTSHLTPREGAPPGEAARGRAAERDTTGPSHAKAWLLVLLGVVVLGVLGWVFRAKLPFGAGAKPAGSAEPRPVPVAVVAVTLRDVPIYLEGLGNALPLATVTVKSQVDGRLDRVFFKEGQMVHRGELIAQIDPRPFQIQLQTALAAAARDDAQLRNAKLNLARYTTLRAQNLIPQQQVDDQQTVVDQQLATVKSDLALADTARLMIDYARIVSPIDGVTGVRLVDAGNLVHASDAGGLVVITQLDPMAVLFTLPEDDLPRVAKQLAAGPIAVDAFNRDGSTKLASGVVSLIDNQVNVATATIRVKATFPNGDKALWPNEFVKARLLLTTRVGAIAVPAPVVQRGPQGTYAYVVGADDTVSMRPIEVEMTQADWALIKSGLKLGEQVVVDGQNIRPGAKVAPRPPEKAAGAGAAPGASPSASARSGSGGGAAP